ncbi:hypothetical protein V2J09_020166 [Rumex salicifolius]
MGESFLVGNLQSVYFCRVCLEEELQDSHRLEAPCACSGTSKFAHRECIQRWCYEKGNTTCEICLQKFRPGYTAVPEINQVIIREIPNLNWDEENLEIPREDQREGTLNALLATEFQDPPDDQTPSCCKSIVLIFIVLLLVKNMLAVRSGGWKLLSGFWQFMMIAVRTFGYIIPTYIIIWTMIVIQKCHHHQQLQHLHLIRNSNRNHVDEQPLRIRIDN